MTEKPFLWVLWETDWEILIMIKRPPHCTHWFDLTCTIVSEWGRHVMCALTIVITCTLKLYMCVCMHTSHTTLVIKHIQRKGQRKALLLGTHNTLMLVVQCFFVIFILFFVGISFSKLFSCENPSAVDSMLKFNYRLKGGHCRQNGPRPL